MSWRRVHLIANRRRGVGRLQCGTKPANDIQSVVFSYMMRSTRKAVGPPSAPLVDGTCANGPCMKAFIEKLSTKW
jgi:hypothetical protein